MTLPPKRRLLIAAEELFGERSYRKTTVADICARAGIATGTRWRRPSRWTL